MKKLTLFILGVAFSHSLAFSQGCLPEGITFTTQEQIDNFQTNYPGCREIEGDVYIIGGVISNLNGLSALTSIGGNLWITGNAALTSLTGLNNLTSTGGDLEISSNPALTSLTGLEGVTSIGEELAIYYNETLTSLTGLDNITSIGGNLEIYGNQALSSITSLNYLTSIGGNLLIEGNFPLTSLTGLEGVTSIGGDLYIINNLLLSNCEAEGICAYLSNPNGAIIIGNNSVGCSSVIEAAVACGTTMPCLEEGTYSFYSQFDIDNFPDVFPGCADILCNMFIGGDDIANLDSLGGIISIGGYLVISYNDALTSLTGLDNIDAGSISDLEFTYNSLLSTCDVQSVCNYLASPNGTISIHNNAPGCNNPEEVIESCLTPIESIFSNKEILIYPNPGKDFLVISTLNGVNLYDAVIYNQTGQKVLQEKPINTTLDISKLRPGMYIVELVTDQGKMRKKLMVE